MGRKIIDTEYESFNHSQLGQCTLGYKNFSFNSSIDQKYAMILESGGKVAYYKLPGIPPKKDSKEYQLYKEMLTQVLIEEKVGYGSK